MQRHAPLHPLTSMRWVSELEAKEVFIAQRQLTGHADAEGKSTSALLPPALPRETTVLPATDPNAFYVVDPARFPEAAGIQLILRALMGLRQDILATYLAHMTKYSPSGRLIPQTTSIIPLRERPTEGSTRRQALEAVAAREVAEREKRDKLAKAAEKVFGPGVDGGGARRTRNTSGKGKRGNPRPQQTPRRKPPAGSASKSSPAKGQRPKRQQSQHQRDRTSTHKDKRRRSVRIEERADKQPRPAK